MLVIPLLFSVWNVTVLISPDLAAHEEDQGMVCLYSSFVEFPNSLFSDFPHILLSKAVCSVEILEAS
jgi:hypothetical protein